MDNGGALVVGGIVGGGLEVSHNKYGGGHLREVFGILQQIQYYFL